MIDTFYALATPPGSSALAVVRVSGPAVPSLIQDVFGRKPEEADFRKAVLGYYRSMGGEKVDQVLYAHFPAATSYTGRELLEISLHGNMFLVEQILEDLGCRGCRMADPGEFTRTAFLEGRMDLSQAEAVADLIEARSAAALEAAHRQLAGGLGKEIQSRVDELLAIRAHVEAFIDFPEEDLPDENQEGPIAEIDHTLRQLDSMLSTGRQRELLHRGVRTVLLGVVNAGKSSLLNQLLGEDRAIVSETEGTTRDYLQDVLQLGPYCIQIFDTAGFRKSTDVIELEGLRRTEKVAGGADFLLLVLDGSAPSPTLPDELLERMTPENSLLVWNKSDQADFAPDPEFLPNLPRVTISAKAGTGIHELREIWESRIRSELLEGAENRVLYNRRHIGHLQSCRDSLVRAREALVSGISTECVAPDLRDALDELGAIVGTIDNEDMLDVLFGDFCIGK
ncbi:tRNA uridine-5-carboxymethylaminomethyl(34) synthesis GTPase MnmE [Puniceicoccus vermicola]|uniref:tRNA modification GTPase MnmE n=1 Tax=Puniceicoccus vermicola TaxID=388746 RepID=A0A7X1E5B7_9BACT|nr:tRNA uridine-5-carboxymethylaminomethyl(34) synthesis GTPase MnmE [Puniceicoccus vermicola]MBC2601432.1 tRNA uridine-5-carboxymethylaminomethyl(34) synthesis GTPase MnmE [Puniceicoccus vermicola]